MCNPRVLRRKSRKARNRPRIEVIYKLQNGICYLCNKSMPHPKNRTVSPHEIASLDHVVPKNPIDPSKGCLRVRKNGLVAHHGCNNRKHNRMPHPCELLHLELINEKLRELEARKKFPYVTFVRQDNLTNIML